MRVFCVRMIDITNVEFLIEFIDVFITTNVSGYLKVMIFVAMRNFCFCVRMIYIIRVVS